MASVALGIMPRYPAPGQCSQPSCMEARALSSRAQNRDENKHRKMRWLMFKAMMGGNQAGLSEEHGGKIT